MINEGYPPIINVQKYPFNSQWAADLGQILVLCQSLEKKVDDVSTGLLEAAKAYTDAELAEYQSQLDVYKQQVNAVLASMQQSLTAQITLFNARIDTYQRETRQELDAQQAITNTKISRAVDGLRQEISTGTFMPVISNIITGQITTVQDMFNFLCAYHTQNGITAQAITDRCITAQHLVDLAITTQQLVVNGNSLIK